VNARPDPTTGPITIPRVTSVTATVKVPATRGRFGVHTVAWLPSESWFCGCDAARMPCAHVAAVLAAITPKATP
jgi:hypothetical protein